MQSLVGPIERVVEATEWFVRTPSLRVLQITTTALLRIPVLQHVTATELLDANESPFFVLEAPTEPGDDGWATRCEELRADWEALSETSPETLPMAPLWPECTTPAALPRFAQELSQALRTVRPPMRGLVIVLAPVWVRDPLRWSADLRALLGEPSLRSARFVVVELEEAASLPALEGLGAALERVDARVDDLSVRDEMNARLDAMRAAPRGVTGPQLVGAAGPSVPPPARRNQVKPLGVEERAARAREVGVPEALLDPDAMQQLRVLVLSAALAMRDGKVAEGVELQRKARDFCLQNGLLREGVVNELVLAGLVMQSGDPAKAMEVFRDARTRAEQGGLADLAVQAQIAIGSCLLVQKRFGEAATAYAEGGRAGARAGALILSIESFRMCGQVLASQGHLEQAAAAFREALVVAEAGSPTERASSSAPEAARALAVICRGYGLTVQADALEAQANVLEASGTPSIGDHPTRGAAT